MGNVIVFGASGQLGQCLKFLAEKENKSSLVFPIEAEANILDTGALGILFEKHKPAYCINCAAYTAVDKAEDEPEVSLKVNKTGVENLSVLCKEYNAVLIHISTDFVFKGDQSTPRKEDDLAEPINVYGQTKLDGEQVVRELLNRYFIIRTGWLYSEYGNNFVKTMLRLGTERPELKVIADQVGTPTYAIDLATCVLQIIDSGSEAYGVYHYSSEGVASWYDFAKAIFDLNGNAIKLLPIKTEEYITKARRPAYSVMDKSKIKGTFGIEIPYWRDSLAYCLGILKSKI